MSAFGEALPSIPAGRSGALGGRARAVTVRAVCNPGFQIQSNTQRQERTMEIYKGRLAAKKLTKRFVVYGNEDLHAQYLPKAMFKGRKLKKHPPVVVIQILLPNPLEVEKRRTRKKKHRAKAFR
jgi:hypothetical protein